ncbi:ribulose-phosphate 3-epimerase [Candidatus Woesearchaeota archaeon]|nr:ribulose-phosphate 3-epimerase [Candidatus Woesearchaeota archaeon]
MERKLAMQKNIIPAIIAKSQAELNFAFARVRNFANMVQLDVMDGKFVPNVSFQFPWKLPKTDIILEAHLMVEHPLRWIRVHGKKVDTILFHNDCSDDIEAVLAEIRKHGKRSGLVINPEVPVSSIEKYFGNIDEVLVMTVHPGFYGSPFLPETLSKVRELRKLLPGVNIEVDGGITDKTINKTADAGANYFVSGSFIMKSENPRSSFIKLNNLVK